MKKSISKINRNAKSRKLQISLLLGIIASMIFIHCGGSADLLSDYSIRISSVVPDSGLTDGISTSFDVCVEYHLTEAAEAELNIGFNQNHPFICDYVSGQEQIITSGEGIHCFTGVSVTPKDWGSIEDF